MIQITEVSPYVAFSTAGRDQSAGSGGQPTSFPAAGCDGGGQRHCEKPVGQDCRAGDAAGSVSNDSDSPSEACHKRHSGRPGSADGRTDGRPKLAGCGQQRTETGVRVALFGRSRAGRVKIHRMPFERVADDPRAGGPLWCGADGTRL